VMMKEYLSVRGINMKTYEVCVVDETEEEYDLYKTTNIEFLEHGWLKVKNANLWYRALGEWSKETFTRIFPNSRVLWVDEEL